MRAKLGGEGVEASAESRSQVERRVELLRQPDGEQKAKDAALVAAQQVVGAIHRAMLRGVTATMQKNPSVLFAVASVGFEHEWKYLATSEGSFIEQVFHFIDCSLEATARTGTQVKTRSYDRLAGSGYEFLAQVDLPGNAERVAAEAVEHSMARPVGQGLKDLVLMPSHLGLTIHEIVAHATEVDRIAG